MYLGVIIGMKPVTLFLQPSSVTVTRKNVSLISNVVIDVFTKYVHKF